MAALCKELCCAITIIRIHLCILSEVRVMSDEIIILTEKIS